MILNVYKYAINLNVNFLFQLFVYLFAPLCNHLKDIDFKTNLRLENGLKIWSAMYECRHPDTPCFTTHCRIKPQALWSRSFKTYKQHQMSDDVFVGRSKQHISRYHAIFMLCGFHYYRQLAWIWEYITRVFLKYRIFFLNDEEKYYRFNICSTDIILFLSL